MAYEVTATRRRPQQFESLAGQDFVVSTLKNAIEQGRIAHAYLFSGPRGVGKTTSARLLAKALNCVHGPTANPCGECDNCKGIAKGNSLDVIEIDGASNTGVNDVRAIKEEVLFPPTSSRYKIYIIDEVHMLSLSAFNALLKTIEEPPEYVVFIFATTETQKVPATIRSRCQQFNFQLIPLETIERLLRDAAREMNIKADRDALFWIAKEAAGSMRDAYTLFDQVVSFSGDEITLAKIREKLGIVGMDRINQIMTSLLARKQDDALAKVGDLLAKGVSIEQVIKDFTDYFRTLLLIKEGIKSENVLGEQIETFPAEIRSAFNEEQLEAALEMFLTLYRDIRYSLNPRFELELAVSKLSRLRYVASNASVLEQLARLKNDLVTGTITPLNPALAEQKSIEPLEPLTKIDTPHYGSAEPISSSKQVTNAEQDKPSEQIMRFEQVTNSKQDENSDHIPNAEQVSGAKPVAAHEQIPNSEHFENFEKIENFNANRVTRENASKEDTARTLDLETIKDLLPQGVLNARNENNGLILEFGNKLCYQLALNSRQKVKEGIKERTGIEVNIVPSLSETQNQAESSLQTSSQVMQTSQEMKTSQLAQMSQTTSSLQNSQNSQTEPQIKSLSTLEEERKNLVNDLILAFDGKEEKQ